MDRPLPAPPAARPHDHGVAESTAKEVTCLSFTRVVCQVPSHCMP